MMKKVVIEEIGGSFSIYDEAGQCIEPDFKSYGSAKKWAKNNNLEVVNSFNL